MRHKGVSPQTDPGRLGTTEDAWADSMKAFPGYDDRPPPTGLNRGGGSDPLTSEDHSWTSRWLGHVMQGWPPMRPPGAHRRVNQGLNGHSRIDRSPVSFFYAVYAMSSLDTEDLRPPYRKLRKCRDATGICSLPF